ncbi:hypothetical protein Tmath_1547 [Thermoanaerobacter mathranii subsp. mathranii str. A3]|uniref:Uncharacterized protein n=1 Tax=Thermoanaerobacter mathranii subsp. mathranii (strain DSM 11426 / CCUG 53645 / CIP 108742 / A3) TaxID=583358 RepID=A0ABM5LR97_THEM3|nr:hypothetical protein [Thermoanaerobacter mathranii]ADH61256.1 hypothetical protein Tmath_1547 [Thermoanaerobacter mathranii subsp. mathranii str. A3]
MKIVRIFLIATLLLLMVSGTAVAVEKNDITPAIAKKAAIFHILNDIQTDTNSEWKGGKVTLSKA